MKLGARDEHARQAKPGSQLWPAPGHGHRDAGDARRAAVRWDADSTAMVASGYEKQPVLKASQLAPAELLKGTDFQVDETVPTDGFLGRFTIRSEVGTFEARGRERLRIRGTEVGAIKQLDAVSKTETFAKALGSAVMRPVKAVGQIVTHPGETAKGLPSGVDRLFGRVKLGTDYLGDAATASDKSSTSTGSPLPAASASMPSSRSWYPCRWRCPRQPSRQISCGILLPVSCIA